MAELVGRDDVESLRIELSELGRTIRESFQRCDSSFRSNSGLSNGKDDNLDEEIALQWAVIDRLPTFERMKSCLFDESNGNEVDAKTRRVVDVTKLGALDRHLFIEKLIRHIEHDNLRLLQKIRNRIDRIGIKLPTVEVRYRNLHVEAECEVVFGKPLPTLWNSFKSGVLGLARIARLRSQISKICILSDVSGIVKPGRVNRVHGNVDERATEARRVNRALVAPLSTIAMDLIHTRMYLIIVQECKKDRPNISTLPAILNCQIEEVFHC